MRLTTSLFIVVLLIIKINCFAQPPKEAGDLNRFITADHSIEWANGDSAQKLFYNLNKDRIQGLTNALTTLKIDRCRHYQIQIQITLNSDGNLEDVNLIKGSDFVRTDSTIRSLFNNQPGRWRMPFMVKPDSNFKSTLNFYLLNDYEKRGHIRAENDYYIYTADYKITDPGKSCKDADFYYESGLKYFNDGNFKHAISDFERVINLNPYDVDALYNLAIANYKMGNKEEACLRMKQAAELDVTIDQETIDQVCGK